MKVSQFYATRDEIIIAEILNSLPADQKENLSSLIRSGFDKGKDTFVREFLPIAVGQQGAQHITARLNSIDLG